MNAAKLSVSYAFAPRWSSVWGASHGLTRSRRRTVADPGAASRCRAPGRSCWVPHPVGIPGVAPQLRLYRAAGVPDGARILHQAEGGIEGMGLGWGCSCDQPQLGGLLAGVNCTICFRRRRQQPVVGARDVWGANLYASALYLARALPLAPRQSAFLPRLTLAAAGDSAPGSARPDGWPGRRSLLGVPVATAPTAARAAFRALNDD